MKTKEELKALKEEVETLNKKLHDLTDEEEKMTMNEEKKDSELKDEQQMNKKELKEEELSKVNGGSFYERGHTWSDYPPHHLIVTMGYGCSLYEGPADRARCCFWCRHCFEDSFLGVVLYCDKRTYNNDPVDNIFNGIGQTSGRF